MPAMVSQAPWCVEDIEAQVDRVADKHKAIPYSSPTRGLPTKQINEVIREVLRSGEIDEEPFYIVDLGVIEEQMHQWKEHLPRVRPFYAYKCNGNPVLVETLKALGAGFDCASKFEFETVIEMGVNPAEDIIFANPCKQVSHIKAARQAGLKYVTFDNEYELPKIKEHWPEAKVLLRIVTDDSKSICEFSSKYGASLEICPRLIQQASDLGLDLVGVSFHVGSGCGDAEAFVDAAKDARRVFDMAADLGFDMTILDIGGGFPGDKVSRPTFQEIASALRPALDELFPDTKIIAEPGRYFACASHTLAANVFAKREIDVPEEGDHEPLREVQYYLNEGLYQSFNCIFFDHAIVEAKPVFMDPADEEKAEIKSTTIFGPTCDGLDCIAKRIDFPELKLGDWVMFEDFGAYTCAAASSFNGFRTKKIKYIRSSPKFIDT